MKTPIALTYNEERETHNEWKITDAATINACIQAISQINVGEETELRTMDAGETLVFQMADGNTWTLDFEAGNLLRNNTCYETDGWKKVQNIIRDYLYGGGIAMRLRDGKKAGTLLLAALLLTGCGGAENTSDAVMSVNEDTAAGTWELVSMTYNGMTVGKEDLEEMGTSMTLNLLEDGTGTMDYDGTVYDLTWDDSAITTDGVADAYMLEDGVLVLANEETEMVFERQGSMAAVTAPDEEEGEQTADSRTETGSHTEASIEDNWTVVPLASAQELVPYSCTEFSMNIPQGWTVRSSAMYTGMFHAIHAFDPENPVNQIFFMLKMEPLFSDENTRAMMALSSDLLGSYPVLTNVSTQGVFEIFSQIADALIATPDYTEVQAPHIADFSVTESFESTQGMSNVAISPSILRADFTQDGMAGEGMFTADVVPFAMGTGMGYYSVYNLTVLSAKRELFRTGSLL